MTDLRLRTPLVVEVSGLDPIIPAAAWAVALRHVGLLLQARIRTAYARSRNALGEPFLPNSPTYDLWKARQGYDLRPGHQQLRIQHTMRTEMLFGVSSVSPRGSAVITMLEPLLHARQPHAYHYERNKVPRRWLLAINPAWLEMVRWPLDQLAARAATTDRARQRGSDRAAHIAAAERSATRSTGFRLLIGPREAMRFAVPVADQPLDVQRRIAAQASAARNATTASAVTLQQQAWRLMSGMGADLATETTPAIVRPTEPRRVWTLAQTAWTSVLQTTNRLRALGRVRR